MSVTTKAAKETSMSKQLGFDPNCCDRNVGVPQLSDNDMFMQLVMELDIHFVYSWHMLKKPSLKDLV